MLQHAGVVDHIWLRTQSSKHCTASLLVSFEHFVNHMTLYCACCTERLQARKLSPSLTPLIESFKNVYNFLILLCNFVPQEKKRSR
jgi:hypothetical protein